MSAQLATVDRDLEQRIRERAYALWEQEGFPQGRDRIHWDLARAQIASETAQAKPKPARKPAARSKATLRAVR